MTKFVNGESRYMYGSIKRYKAAHFIDQELLYYMNDSAITVLTLYTNRVKTTIVRFMPRSVTKLMNKVTRLKCLVIHIIMMFFVMYERGGVLK